MKNAIILVSLIILIFVGCSGTSGTDIERPDISFSPEASSSNKLIPTSSAVPEVTEAVDTLSIMQFGATTDKYYSLMDWQEYINEKFNVDINLFYSNRAIPGEIIYYYNYNPAYAQAGGSRLLSTLQKDTVYDLSPYYEMNGWNNFIDSSYIEELTENGRIFAVPTAPTKYIIPRYYNKEYLEMTGSEIPTDINSFHEFLIKSKNVMEGDGKLLPMFVSLRRIFPGTADIFRAYGAYVNSEHNSSISFNPNTQSYEDAVFSDNFADAISFIKNLQDTELMGIWGEGFCPDDRYKNPFIGDRFKINKNLATEYNIVYDQKSNSFQKFCIAELGYEAAEGYYLMHLNDKNICEIRSDMGFYVFPNKISNIQGTIDLFNTVMTDQKFYADLLYGMENIDYVYLNDEMYPNPPKLGSFPALRLLVPSDDQHNYFSPGNIDIVNEIASDLVYESNIFNQVSRYGNTINVTIHSSYQEHLFSTCVSASDAIEEYKKWFFQSGMLEGIVKVNEEIGTSPSYDYNP